MPRFLAEQARSTHQSKGNGRGKKKAAIGRLFRPRCGTDQSPLPAAFGATLQDIYEPATAERIHLAARRMAGGLTHGLFGPETQDGLSISARPD